MVDAVIVGAGPCGSLVAHRLVSRGFSVTVLEAGERFDAVTNTEANAKRILWSEPRVHDGPHGVAPKMGMGAGGGTLAWLGVMPRFQPEDFRDWPFSYGEVAEHYRQVEGEFGVAGGSGPMPAHRMNWHAQVLAHGARALGAHPFAPPVAVNSVERDGRPACVYCGWCASGCASGAKATGANTYLARAESAGARVVTGAFVHRVLFDNTARRVTGVEYVDCDRREHRVDARIVVLAAHAVETPRLLLMSGIANSSGLVGRYFLSHPTWQVFGEFDEPINAYKGMQMGHVMVADFMHDDRFVLISYMMTPGTYANLSGSSYGAELKDFLHAYTRMAAWWGHAEGDARETNTVTLDPSAKDARGLPVARVTYAWSDADLQRVETARAKAAEMMAASGARRVINGLRYGAHAMGGCRMGRDPRTSVVNEWGQSHDVRNLFVCDTSLFVTGSAVNPTLTAMAVASRSAGWMADAAGRGEL